MALRLVAAGLAAAAYLGGSHWLMTSAPSSRWSAVAIVGPMLAAAAAVAWQRRQRMFAIVLAGATAALVVQAGRGGGVTRLANVAQSANGAVAKTTTETSAMATK